MLRRGRSSKKKEDDPPAAPPVAPKPRKRKSPSSKEPEGFENPEEPSLPLQTRSKKRKEQEAAEPGGHVYLTRRQLDISTNELRDLKDVTENEPSDNLKGLVEVHNLNQPDQIWLELPAPPNKEIRKWPLISFGDHAPTPRWRIIRDKAGPEDGRDLSQDLIRTRTGRTIIGGLRPGDVARSFDSDIGLGGLAWKFDPGVPAGWMLLDETQLYEYAFRCLEAALADHGAREQFRGAIANMSIGNFIANVEDPLPPIPPAPPKSDFGVINGLIGVNEVITPLEHIHWYWDGYKRPSLAVREGCNGGGGGPKTVNPLVERMFYHMAGIMGDSVHVSPTYDSDSHESDASAPPRAKNE